MFESIRLRWWVVLSLACTGCGSESDATATGTTATTTTTSPTSTGDTVDTESTTEDPTTEGPTTDDPTGSSSETTDPTTDPTDSTDPTMTTEDPTTQTEDPTEGTDTSQDDCLVDGHYFPDGAVWYEDISDWPVDTESDPVIAWLDGQGWGTGEMRIDYSIEVLQADENTTFRTFEPTGDFYTPDCDLTDVPVPPGGQLEGEEGYECTSDGDCHLIVVHPQSCQLFEMWRANIVDEQFYGGCLAVWEMDRVYGPKGRGEQCTSADAAGYPIAPLLFTADEVAAGNIDHAIRFILPNARIREGEYVHPATHGTPATSGPPDAPPYGARLRLRADFPLDTLPNEGARTVAKAMQQYGILLADGGNIALTAQSDRYTVAKWEGLLGTFDLTSITPGDFEMVDGGERIELTLDCVREP